MKCIMNPRPDIQEELIKPYKEMEDVYSLSCVVGDAMEREQVMRHDMKPKSINKKNNWSGYYCKADSRRYRGVPVCI